MALDATLVAAGLYDDEAIAALPDRRHSVAIKRRPIWHQTLGNEYYRSVLIYGGGRITLEATIGPDTGGYAMVQVFDNGLLLTDGLNCYRLDLRQGAIDSIDATDQAELHFIGAFDEDGEKQRFRFLGAEERAAKSFAYTRPEWCLRSGPR